METLGKKIRKLRKDAGLTQARMALLLGVSQGTISQYEDDTISIPAINLPQIADVLGVSPSKLLSDQAPVAAPPRAPTTEEMALAVLSALLPEGFKLSAIRSILNSDLKEGQLHSINAILGNVSAAGKKRESR